MSQGRARQKHPFKGATEGASNWALQKAVIRNAVHRYDDGNFVMNNWDILHIRHIWRVLFSEYQVLQWQENDFRLAKYKNCAFTVNKCMLARRQQRSFSLRFLLQSSAFLETDGFCFRIHKCYFQHPYSSVPK